MPPVMVQYNTEAVDKASVYKQVHPKDKQVGANEGGSKYDDVTFQQEDRYRCEPRCFL
jgi:hypothetical protein